MPKFFGRLKRGDAADGPATMDHVMQQQTHHHQYRQLGDMVSLDNSSSHWRNNNSDENIDATRDTNREFSRTTTEELLDRMEWKLTGGKDDDDKYEDNANSDESCSSSSSSVNATMMKNYHTSGKDHDRDRDAEDEVSVALLLQHQLPPQEEDYFESYPKSVGARTTKEVSNSLVSPRPRVHFRPGDLADDDDDDETTSTDSPPRQRRRNPPPSERLRPRPKKSSMRRSTRYTSHHTNYNNNNMIIDPNHSVLQDVTTESLRAIHLSATLASEALGFPMALDPDCMNNPKAHCVHTTTYVASNAVETTTTSCGDDKDNNNDNNNNRKRNVWGRKKVEKPLANAQEDGALMPAAPRSSTTGSFFLDELFGVHEEACGNDTTRRATSKRAQDDTMGIKNQSKPPGKEYSRSTPLFSIMNRTLEKSSKKSQKDAKKNGESLTNSTVDTLYDTVASSDMAAAVCDYLFTNALITDGEDYDDDDHATSDGEDDDAYTYGSRTSSYQSSYGSAWTSDDDNDDDNSGYDPFGVYLGENPVPRSADHGELSSKSCMKVPWNKKPSTREPPTSKGRVFAFLRRGRGAESAKEPNHNRLRLNYSPAEAAIGAPSASSKGILAPNKIQHHDMRKKKGKFSSLSSPEDTRRIGSNKILVTRIHKPAHSDPRAIYQSQGEEHYLGAAASLHTIQLGRA
mmetsp:Transcript_15702/g.43316  ORF Transcript_15702/g.43316 Transcript_15702/m.43316 type:complete len:685 (+) Transcript_15702:83-2137(+)|eukprot:CAMPEP_0168738644 /NCGR_PEP_ID=MMETSP0724-20121128/11042_1 /TAXON_ID=265536 /ORGANISM="Amphiprora sp., Strain CCMP467" /LENGTH=684 /DNA_ID=CAMNT_0008785999 /DNA_START=72 /DNA_END=2126 /DNA_ORIENTATION=-